LATITGSTTEVRQLERLDGGRRPLRRSSRWRACRSSPRRSRDRDDRFDLRRDEVIRHDVHAFDARSVFCAVNAVMAEVP
jgi:hypothetical protein